MTAVELIVKKRSGQPLTAKEINFLVNGFTAGEIPDYQMSAFLMAVCFNSLDNDETAHFTQAMMNSGRTYFLRHELGGVSIDKHSTGGVGDKVSLICAPICAACGIYVPKMSGRGLGATGGTIDKLESIPGFMTSITHEQFVKIIRETGFSIMCQTPDIVPADKKIYALRDVTGTVDSIPLIASSVMSKKLATGADGIVLDVKVGSGAFMKNAQDAMFLANTMKTLAEKAGRRCSVLLTDMANPLGKAVGNAIEVIEACEVLKGRTRGDLRNTSVTIAAHMLYLAGKGDLNTCIDMAQRAIDSGAAFERLERSISMQGGNYQALSRYSLLGKASESHILTAESAGYISGIDAFTVGVSVLALGSGRRVKGAAIDHSAGIKLLKSVGDYVSEGDELAILYTSSHVDIEAISKKLLTAFSIVRERTERRKAIISQLIS